MVNQKGGGEQREKAEQGTRDFKMAFSDELGGLLEEERHEPNSEAHDAEQEPLGEILAKEPPSGLLLEILSVNLGLRHAVVQALIFVHPLLLWEGEMMGCISWSQISVPWFEWGEANSLQGATKLSISPIHVCLAVAREISPSFFLIRDEQGISRFVQAGGMLPHDWCVAADLSQLIRLGLLLIPPVGFPASFLLAFEERRGVSRGQTLAACGWGRSRSKKKEKTKET